MEENTIADREIRASTRAFLPFHVIWTTKLILLMEVGEYDRDGQIRNFTFVWYKKKKERIDRESLTIWVIFFPYELKP